MNDRMTAALQMCAPALVLACLAAGCASPRGTNPHAGHAVERMQIERRLQEIFTAAEEKDFDRLESYHFYGRKFTKFSGSSSERQDAAASRKGEHDGLATIKGLKMRADRLKIDVFGDVGIATFILDYRYDSGVETIELKDRSTMVFVRDRGAWKIAHEHLSPIKP